MGCRQVKLKNDKARLKKLEDQSISLTQFLRRGVGVTDNTLLSSPLSHKDIKAIFPQLTRTSFDDILANPDKLASGEVLLVTDCLNQTIPYYNPLYLDLEESRVEQILDGLAIKSDLTEEEITGEFVKPQSREEIIEVPDIKRIDLKSYSIYELCNLLSLYKRLGMRGAARKVNREIVSRPESHQASVESIKRLEKKKHNKRTFEEE